MTASPIRIGFRPRAQRLMSRLAAALVVGAIAVGTHIPTAAASTSEDASTDEPGVVELHLSTGSGGTLTPGAALTGTITVDNGTDTELSAGFVTVELNRTPLPDGEDLEAWLADGTSSGRFDTIAIEPTVVVERDSRSASRFTVDASALGTLSPGVYPVRAGLSGARTGEPGETASWEVSATTVLVVSSRPRASVLLVPITATPADGALLTAAELAELTAPDGALSAQLDAVRGSTAVVAIDPAIPAAIRMLGTRAPSAAVDWLESFESLSNDIIALQFGDADAATQAHAALPELLAPGDLVPLLQPDDFPPPVPSPPPTSAPEPDLPGTPELTAVSGALPGVLWPRGDVSDADIAAFTGYVGGPVTTIVPSSAVSGAAPAHGIAAGQQVLVTDAPTSARLSAAAELADDAARDREIAAAAAHLFFAEQRTPLVLIGLSRSETRAAAALEDVVDAFTSPAVQLGTVTAVAAEPVALAAEPDAERASALSQMLSDEQRLVPFSAILEEPAVLLEPSRIRVMRAIGVGITTAMFPAVVADQTARVTDTLAAVSIQHPKPVQLFTSAAPLPVWVRNDLPWPVSVTLSSRPSDPRLDIQPLTQVDALESSATRVDVPIEARVASGDVRVEFRLYGPDGQSIGVPEVADVTLRADWEGIGLGVLGAIIALLFGIGVVRTIVRRRRVRSTSTRTTEEAT